MHFIHIFYLYTHRQTYNYYQLFCLFNTAGCQNVDVRKKKKKKKASCLPSEGRIRNLLRHEIFEISVKWHGLELLKHLFSCFLLSHAFPSSSSSSSALITGVLLSTPQILDANLFYLLLCNYIPLIFWLSQTSHSCSVNVLCFMPLWKKILNYTLLFCWVHKRTILFDLEPFFTLYRNI